MSEPSIQALPSEAKRKPAPQPYSGKAPAGGLHFQYAAAPDGADSNLLILLHGLGDNERSFFTLGQQLQRTLPQTAVLSLRAPMRVPLLEEESYSWWETFTPLAESEFGNADAS